MAYTKLQQQRWLEIKLVAFFLAREVDGFPLAFSICGVQGKLKFLLRFGLIVSLLFSFVHTH